jgi:hypothetical protein
MRFKSLLLIVFAFLSVVIIGGCGFVSDGPFGWVYTDTKLPVAVGPSESGSLEGKACIHSFLGMITIGDASIETAMKEHAIKTIYTVNKESLSIFGTYTRQCTVVTGEAEAAKKSEALNGSAPATTPAIAPAIVPVPVPIPSEGITKKDDAPK